ncbi:MAG: cell wall hydrolase [Pseudorhodoplanes sp.]
MPTSTGYQDLGSFIARQPSVSQRWREHVLASPFGTIHAATFSFPRPIGTAIPETPSLQLASFDPRSLDITGSLPDEIEAEPEAPLVFPTVNRTLKGDLLVSRPKPPQPELPPAASDKKRDLAEKFGLDAAPQPAEAAPSDLAMLTDSDWKLAPADEPTGHDPDIWPPAEKSDSEQQMVSQPTPRSDPDIKLSAQHPSVAPASQTPVDAAAEGQTVAGKGEVTGAGKRPKTPAERLALEGKPRAKAEKCLADAVYFESRGESERGQIAVAQVVMNRVFSPFYPDSVCGVVYQNAHRHLACQFTFACEGKRLVVDEPDAWAQAKRIARDTLDGKLWLPQVGKSTHYHAYWVRPRWIREMKRNYKLGVHTFYRPRAWGDGSDEPSWSAGAAPSISLEKATATGAPVSVGEAKL